MPAIKPDQVPQIFSSPKLDNVNELEFDLLLSMALRASPNFAKYFLGKAYRRTSPVGLVGAYRGWGATQCASDK
jgi:hypothetical protein